MVLLRPVNEIHSYNSYRERRMSPQDSGVTNPSESPRDATNGYDPSSHESESPGTPRVNDNAGHGNGICQPGMAGARARWGWNEWILRWFYSFLHVIRLP